MHPDDLGRVIGQSGRTATALRTVLSALADGKPRPRRRRRRRRALSSAAAARRAGRPYRPCLTASRVRSPSRSAPTSPSAASRPAPCSVARAGAGPGRSPSQPPAGTAARLLLASSRVSDRNGAEAAARRAPVGRGRRRRGERGPRGVLRPPAASASPCATVEGARSARSTDVAHLPGQDLLVVAPAGRPRGRSSRSWPRSSPRSTSRRGFVVIDPPPGLLDLDLPDQAPRGAGRRAGASRRAARRRHDLPRVPRSAATSRWSARPRARAASTVGVHDLRAWTHDRHRTVDDTPYGGGPGMVMKPEPWGEALDAVLDGDLGAQPAACVVVPTPSGRPFTQALAAGARRAALAGLRVRPLRGHRRPGGRRTTRTGCRRRRGQHRRLRARRRRGRRAGRWSRPSPGCCPACSATPSSVVDDSFAPGAMAACSRGRSTPSRRSGAGARCRTSCARGDHGRIAALAARPGLRPHRAAPARSAGADAGRRRPRERGLGALAGMLWQTGTVRAAPLPHGGSGDHRRGGGHRIGTRHHPWSTCGAREENACTRSTPSTPPSLRDRHPGLPPRRHRQGARQGHRGQPLPHPGLPGRRHPPPGRRRARDLHRPQGQLRRRRRAHLPGAHARSSRRSRS